LDKSVSLVTVTKMDSIYGAGQGCFSLRNFPSVFFLNPASCSVNVASGVFCRVKSVQRLKLTTHLNLVPWPSSAPTPS